MFYDIQYNDNIYVDTTKHEYYTRVGMEKYKRIDIIALIDNDIFTKRERQVVVLLSKHNKTQIAKKLKISKPRVTQICKSVRGKIESLII